MQNAVEEGCCVERCGFVPLLKRHLGDVAEPTAAELTSGFAFLERTKKQEASCLSSRAMDILWVG